MWQLGLALALLTIGVALLRDRCLAGVAATLLANWTINTAMVRMTGDPASWGIFITTDYLSGVFVLVGLGLLCGRFTWGSVVIAMSYGLECIVHAAYGLSDHGIWATYRYWWTTFYIAVGQMMFVTGWGLYELARRYDRARRGMAPDVAGTARRGSAQTIVEP